MLEHICGYLHLFFKPTLPAHWQSPHYTVLPACRVVLSVAVHRDCETGQVTYPPLEQRCQAVTNQDRVRRKNRLNNPGQPDCAARAG